MPDVNTILRIDSSARGANSVSRMLADRLTESLKTRHPQAQVVTRDLTRDPLPVVTEAWFNAAYKPEEARDPADVEALRISDSLVDEFAAADVLVLSAPVYNFTLPAQLKLWIDQVTRVGRTFYFTEDGAKSVLPDRPTFVVVTSGGTPIGSETDHATGYLRLILGLNGLRNITFIPADELVTQGESRIQVAEKQIDDLAAEFEMA